MYSRYVQMVKHYPFSLCSWRESHEGHEDYPRVENEIERETTDISHTPATYLSCLWYINLRNYTNIRYNILSSLREKTIPARYGNLHQGCESQTQVLDFVSLIDESRRCHVFHFITQFVIVDANGRYSSQRSKDHALLFVSPLPPLCLSLPLDNVKRRSETMSANRIHNCWFSREKSEWWILVGSPSLFFAS